MKLLKVFAAIVLTHTLMSSSCSKSDDVAPAPGGTVTGSWKVSYYWDKKDETSNLAGYSFSFNSNGQLVAAKGGTSVNGTWSETSSKLIINFGTDPVLSEINDDWLITEKTATMIKLKEDNPLQDDQLHFIKN